VGSYARAKMANYHVGLGLQQQFLKAGVSATSQIAHPGLSNTDLQAGSVREGGAGWAGAFFEALTARSGMTPLEGARPQLRAATDPQAQGGELYAPRFGSNGPPVRRPILRRFGPAETDRRPVAGLRARDRHRPGRRGGSSSPVSVARPVTSADE
jgi:hypothetical protein